MITYIYPLYLVSGSEGRTTMVRKPLVLSAVGAVVRYGSLPVSLATFEESTSNEASPHVITPVSAI